MHDYADWYHARRNRYFAHQDATSGETARVAMLTADGGAGVLATADSNPGWRPNQPGSANPQLFAYEPREWEPPTLNGETVEAIPAGVYRWTRGGLKGRDFGGLEIDTGQR